MAEAEVNNLGSLGVVRTVASYQLEAPAWTLGENVRIVETGIGKVGLGWVATLGGTPGVAPYFLLPVRNASQWWWLYMSLLKAYVYDGAAHTNITRAAGDYTATDASNFSGTILGGIPILNTANDVPQFWSAYSTAQVLQNLTNWPAGHRTKVIRAFGPYLVAANITIAGTNYPHRVLTSHPADPGSVPSSWDAADATKDVVQVDLPDVQAGVIVNALPLRGQMFIYKEGGTWRMRQIGGRFVFAFDAFLETAGSVAPRCVAITGDGQRHVSLTFDDLIAHDGVRARSLLTRRYKRYLFNQINTTTRHLSFMFDNPDYNEMWFCFCEAGELLPTRALVWNYSDGESGVFTEATLNSGIIAAGLGNIESAGTTTWSGDTGTWDSDDGPWNDSAQRKVVLADQAHTEFFLLDGDSQRDGVNFTSTLQRTDLGFLGQDAKGNIPLCDYKVRKFLNRLWLKIGGAPLQIRMGSQELPDGPVNWSDYQAFDPSSGLYLDFELNGRAFAIEFKSTTNVDWQLESYKVEVFPVGGAG